MQRHAIRLLASVVTFTLGLALAAVPSAFRSGPAPSSEHEREVLSTNQEYLDAHVNRDVAALERLLADEFTVGGCFGRFGSKNQRLALVASPQVSFLSIDGENTRVTADDWAGEVSGRAVIHGRFRGRDYVSPRYGFTRRFVKRDGRWQLVSVRVSCGGAQ